MAEKLTKYTVFASNGRGGLKLGEYEAENAIEAIQMARRDKGRWAAVEMGVEEHDLAWSAEEDFI